MSTGRPATAFVMVNVELGAEREVMEKLKAIRNVKEVHFVFGIYDFVVRVEAETPDKLKETITDRIRHIDHVKSTLTMVVVAPSSS